MDLKKLMPLVDKADFMVVVMDKANDHHLSHIATEKFNSQWAYFRDTHGYEFCVYVIPRKGISYGMCCGNKEAVLQAVEMALKIISAGVPDGEMQGSTLVLFIDDEEFANEFGTIAAQIQGTIGSA